MKKFQKQKKGFTLVEMVLVIGIILILAAVLFISVSGYIRTANTVQASFSSNNSSFISKNKNINSEFINLGY
jgi:prepilin-type N-terminal cleavage/methylation domain-containing protein